MASSMNDDLRGNPSGSKQSNFKREQKERFNSMLSERSEISKHYDVLVGEFEAYQAMLTRIAENSGIERIKKELRQKKLTDSQKRELEKELADEQARIEQKALDATLALTTNTYKQATIARKIELSKQHAEAIAQNREAMDQEYREKLAAAQGDAEACKKIEEQHRKDVARGAELQREANAKVRKLEESESNKHYKKIGKAVKDFKNDKSVKNGLKLAVSVGQLNIDSLKEMSRNAKADYEKARKRTDDAQKEIERLEQAGYDENSEDYQKALKELKDAMKDENSAATSKVIQDELAKVAESLENAFKEAESMIIEYKGHIDARLQGSEKSYNDINNLISSNLSISPFVKTQKVLENMRELVDKGVAYNVEQRAFLQTVSDKIANTFDAFDANLLRLIRLQQADSTTARLGMEASLTKFLNNMFQDTSYLSDVYDSVSAAIIDANATMTRDMSAEFEYVIQKWLGSLSSVGMSSDTINQIATGINYLTTGDVQSLASNTQLQTLIAMSASKAGLSYSDLLLKGLDASSTNKLLASMVSYLKQIAEGADNQVVRAAYGDIFNLSMSDMRAISNLSADDIETIAGNTLSYGNMQSELKNQFAHLLVRTSLTEMMDNVYNNAVFGIAEGLMSNPISYSMYKMLDFMKTREVDWNIPFVNIFGSGLDLNATVGDIMRGGLLLGGAASLVGNIYAGLTSVGGLNLDAWNAQEYTSRGSGMSFSTGTMQGGTSGSTYVASGNGTDMKNSTLNSATDDAQETAEITNKNVTPDHTFEDFYKVAVTGSEGSGYVRTFDSNLAVVFGTDSLLVDDKLKVYDYHLDDYRYIDNVLSVYDMSVDKYRFSNGAEYSLSVVDASLNNMFERFQFTDAGDLKVHDSTLISQLSVTADAVATAVAKETLTVSLHSSQSRELISTIEAAAAKVSTASASVTITGAPKVTIDKHVLVTAFKEALGHKEGSSRDADYRTISDLYRLLAGTAEDDRAHVRVQNEDGNRLQVDTEMGGASFYDIGSSNLRW